MTTAPPTSLAPRSGFVAVVGLPNVGKSTLVNRLVGQKVAIVSPRPQTTRNRILAVMARPGAQLLLFDTPGIHKPMHEMNRRMVETAVRSVGQGDVVLWLVEAGEPPGAGDRFVRDVLAKAGRPVILALNKIDMIEKSGMLKIIEKWSTVYGFKEVVPISARHGTQVDDLIATMEKILPAGPPFFPEDTVTDVSERFMVAELVREQVFRMTGEEIPYATAVSVDTFKEKKEGRLISIEATIHLERSSQKGIVIGKNGSKLKQIGTRSREQIEQLLGTKVFLKLFVRIQKNWRKDTKAIRRFGY